jgi:hypothetical protein
MNRNKINYTVDMLALVTFVITAISGLAIYFFMPEGVRRGGFQEFMGITKNTWVSVHDVVGIIFILLVLLHFILHWQWLVSMTKSIFAGKDEKNYPTNEV